MENNKTFPQLLTVCFLRLGSGLIRDLPAVISLSQKLIQLLPFSSPNLYDQCPVKERGTKEKMGTMYQDRKVHTRLCHSNLCKLELDQVILLPNKGSTHLMHNRAKHWPPSLAVEILELFVSRAPVQETGKLTLKIQTPQWFFIKGL